MATITINNVEFTDFDSNLYSGGCHLVCVDAPRSIVEDILKGKYPGIYPNPSVPYDGRTFYGFYGTPEQCKEAYNTQRNAVIARRVFDIAGSNYDLYPETSQRVEASYKDWWEEVPTI